MASVVVIWEICQIAHLQISSPEPGKQSNSEGFPAYYFHTSRTFQLPYLEAALANVHSTGRQKL